MVMQIILFIVIAYLIGSISPALLVGKIFYNTDIRTMGSGNLGTTNTFRCLGKKAGVIVFVLDISKGIIATMLPSLVKGGKAVATGSGVFIFLYPTLSLILVAIFFSTLFITGYVSLGSILICLTSIVYLSIFESGIDKWIMIVMCIFVIYMHKSNIKRLLNGTENKSKAKIKLGAKK